MTHLSLIGIFLLVAINIAATIGVLRDRSLERTQTHWQIGIIWVLPLVGAVLTAFVRRLQVVEPEPARREAIGSCDHYDAAQMQNAQDVDSHNDPG